MNAMNGRDGFSPTGAGRRGVTLIEVIAIGASAAVLSVLAIVASGVATADEPDARLSSKSLRDAAYARQVHQAMLTFAGHYGGRYPVPGEIKRQPVERDGERRRIPNEGEPDPAQNTTANLYAFMVMIRAVDPRVLVSPVERNSHVAAKRDYDYSVYDPHAATYWDPSFRADLDAQGHTSYAHMPMFGERYKRHWNDSRDGDMPMIGNRGPEDGAIDPDSHTCGPHGVWAGHVVYNDNRSRFHRTTSPEELTLESDGADQRDGLFRIDDGPAGADAILAFTASMTDDGPTLAFD